MDAPVVAALITSSVALVVAAGGAVRSELARASDRRYERRRRFLIDAQDAALTLRDALRSYGAALQTSALQISTSQRQRGVAVPVGPQVRAAETAAAVAEGRLTVARSRVDDGAVVAALVHWQEQARVGLIDIAEQEASTEEAAFAEVNRLIGAGLRSADGRG
jgi:hypothetical protein